MVSNSTVMFEGECKAIEELLGHFHYYLVSKVFLRSNCLQHFLNLFLLIVTQTEWSTLQ